jgi:uncharacterized pyridoxal phosphate-containing UPF0001 family protein
LQSNKVRQIIDKVSTIQSLDSLSLAGKSQKQCEKYGRGMDCLVEVNIGNEWSKSGIAPGQLLQFIEKLRDFDRNSRAGTDG